MEASEQLSSNEYNPYYKIYIDLNTSNNLLDNLELSRSEVVDFFLAIPEDKLLYKYADDKWTIKEIFQHIIDTERVFAYRALRFARADTSPLMGFDQDAFVEPSQANSRTMTALISEYETLRDSTMQLFKGFTDTMLKCVGEASGSPMSARAAGFVIVGHEKHHCNVIKARYLS